MEMGYLYSHALHEVPSGYGNVIRSFTPRPQKCIDDDFVQYALDRGIPLTRIEL
jgi:hypothetical protein